jgi:hypothetical protein
LQNKKKIPYLEFFFNFLVDPSTTPSGFRRKEAVFSIFTIRVYFAILSPEKIPVTNDLGDVSCAPGAPGVGSLSTKKITTCIRKRIRKRTQRFDNSLYNLFHFET